MAEDARYRGHIRTARDHQTGGGVAEGMDIQLLRQAVLLEDQLEAVGKCSCTVRKQATENKR